MFTGIVIGTGKVRSLVRQGGGTRITLEAPRVARSAKVGDSVALNGCCLTAVAVKRPCLAFQAVPETLRRTNLGDLKPGDEVNLELPMGSGERFGGHVVQGHVDGVGKLVSVAPSGLGCTMKVLLPAALTRYVVHKGSLAVDGISLTVASLKGREAGIAVIPHTWDVTNLHRRRPGDGLNIEVDMLAKHIEKLVAPYLRRVRKGR